MGKDMKLRFQEYMIRNWKKGDALSISKYANNRKIWLNLRDGFPHPYSIENAKQFICNAISKHPGTFFALTSSKEAIGSIGISIGEDVHRYTAELGYWLAEPYWGKEPKISNYKNKCLVNKVFYLGVCEIPLNINQ